jgi:hypothetical protein
MARHEQRPSRWLLNTYLFMKKRVSRQEHPVFMAVHVLAIVEAAGAGPRFRSKTLGSPSVTGTSLVSFKLSVNAMDYGCSS